MLRTLFRYLIVSRTRSSLILELGEDMVELEEPLFLSDEPTVAAGELADGGLAVQVRISPPFEP